MIKNFLVEKGDPITPQVRESLPDTFTNPFSYSPHPLCVEAMEQVCKYISSNRKIASLGLLREGKMFGVLVAESPSGELGYLATYSGVLDYLPDAGSCNAFEGNSAYSGSSCGCGTGVDGGCNFFVPPVYDLTSSESFFPAEEAEITDLNDYIRDLYHDSFAQGVLERMEEIRSCYKAEIGRLQEIYEEGKKRRDALRASGVEGDELAALLRESQFQKGEIKRAVKRMNEELEPYVRENAAYERALEKAKKERKEKSAALQRKIFDHFSFLNARGEERSLLNIFGGVVPPAGAGECAAPRLLQYAFLNGYHPIAMGEFWYGGDKLGRREGEFYPSCKGKCGPILGHMLQGLKVDPVAFHSSYGCDPLPEDSLLNIIYEDEYMLAVDKPAGILSVPGKDSSERCVQQLLDGMKRLPGDSAAPGGDSAAPGNDFPTRSFGASPDGDSAAPGSDFWVVHRLDMHTSGVLLLAKNEEVYKLLQRQFLSRGVDKCYVAVLDGVVGTEGSGSGVVWKGVGAGEISLPLMADYENRPLQCVDFERGKPAFTRFETVRVAGGKSFVKFWPVTGRTHQLRVHAAHPLGLNTPIEGDLLYGKLSGRLMLHAHTVKFVHPVTGAAMELVAPIPSQMQPDLWMHGGAQ